MDNEELNYPQRLANAIILKAVDDYRDARKVLAREPANLLAKRQMVQCEEFFLSKWLEVLTDVDGAFILKRLKNEELIGKKIYRGRCLNGRCV